MYLCLKVFTKVCFLVFKNWVFWLEVAVNGTALVILVNALVTFFEYHLTSWLQILRYFSVLHEAK